MLLRCANYRNFFYTVQSRFTVTDSKVEKYRIKVRKNTDIRLDSEIGNMMGTTDTISVKLLERMKNNVTIGVQQHLNNALAKIPYSLENPHIPHNRHPPTTWAILFYSFLFLYFFVAIG